MRPLVAALLFAWTLGLKAESLLCDLHPNTFNSAIETYPPHTQVRADLNGDGLEDYYYLAGEADQIVTCVFFAEKTEDGNVLKLVHRDPRFYDTIGDFTRSGKPQVLLPEMQEGCGEDNGLSLIPERLDKEIVRFYTEWTKGYEKFAPKIAKRSAVAALYLVNPAHIYEYQGGKKTDLTEKAVEFLTLKKKVLAEVIANPKTPKLCKTISKFNLKRLEQYTEVWSPTVSRATTEQCLEKTGLKLGPYSAGDVKFNDGCLAVYVFKGRPKIEISSVKFDGVLGFAGLCAGEEKVNVGLKVGDGKAEVVKDLEKLNPKTGVDVDPRAEGMKVSYRLVSGGNSVIFSSAPKVYGPVDGKRAGVTINGQEYMTAVLDPLSACAVKDELKNYSTDEKKKRSLIEAIVKELGISFEYE